ncbi:hypothetical protein BVRB_8g195820 [Beta vulgaris subsp. vulgaris]|nr:hypothetical protein BVRB_8g195820 [Beta vulgaris subsp. vulgaris]
MNEIIPLSYLSQHDNSQVLFSIEKGNTGRPTFHGGTNERHHCMNTDK